MTYIKCDYHDMQIRHGHSREQYDKAQAVPMMQYTNIPEPRINILALVKDLKFSTFCDCTDDSLRFVGLLRLLGNKESR